jgi:hypothetical protein
MARRRPGIELEHLVPDDLDGLLRDGDQLAPEAVEVVAVEPARAPFEAARIDQVRGADRTHVHAETGVLPDEGSCRARMVEVDMGEDEMPDVGEGQPTVPEGRLERSETRGGPAVDQRRLVTGHEVGGNDPGVPQVEEVEWLDCST